MKQAQDREPSARPQREPRPGLRMGLRVLPRAPPPRSRHPRPYTAYAIITRSPAHAQRSGARRDARGRRTTLEDALIGSMPSSLSPTKLSPICKSNPPEGNLMASPALSRAATARRQRHDQSALYVWQGEFVLEMGAHLPVPQSAARAGALNELTAACLLVACSTCFESARS